MCHAGGEAFIKRLAHGIAEAITAYNIFVPLLTSFIANVLMCKAC